MSDAQNYFERARLLMSQNRYPQAIEQLGQFLIEEPNSPEGHAMMALCLTQNKDTWHDATREAEQAIHCGPDLSLSHYALAIVLEKRKRFPEAIEAANEALRLSPHESQYYGLLASMHTQQSHWQTAYELASQGLEVNPEDETCATIRSLALERLGRTVDASEEAEAAVRRNPDSASAHAMQGWTSMQSGDYRRAQESFREALRLDPTNEFAKSGMIQALNNNYLVFRLVFKFYSFMGRLAGGARWAIILGLFLGMRLLRSLAVQYPAIAPFILPISVLYISFCLLTWIANPLFNTFLRFHKFGKYLLSPKEIWASNLIASALGFGVLSGVGMLVQSDFAGALLAFLAPVLLTMPISTAFVTDSGWPTYLASAIAVAFGLLCVAFVGFLFVDGPWAAILPVYMLGILVFSFAGQYLTNVTVRR